MKLALCQLDIIWENKRANLELCATSIEAASEEHADLIIFPEMTLTGFSMESSAIAETLNGESVLAMKAFARNHAINIIFGMASVQDGHYYNSLLCINRSGELVHHYNKVHPFSLSGEGRYYSAGTSFGGWSIDGALLCGFICYDLRFPELFTRTAVQTQLYVVIANWPQPRIDHWKLLLRARAVDTLAFVAGVNRIGQGGGALYPGESKVFDPWGNEIEGKNDPDHFLFYRNVHLDEVAKTRKHLSVNADRKWDLYGIQPLL